MTPLNSAGPSPNGSGGERFVAAQQMRTPLFFIEWVRGINERLPEMLESVLKEIGQKSAAELDAADREPDAANYLREKLRVTVDPVTDGESLALVQDADQLLANRVASVHAPDAD